MPLASAWLPAPAVFQAAATTARSPFEPRAGWSGRLSPYWQFRWASLVVLACASLVVGAWVSQQAEANALNRTAALTALYVNSALSDPLASLATRPRLAPAEIATLTHLLRDTALGERLVDFRVWSPAGEVLYSSTEGLIGQRYPVSRNLARALGGWVVADLSSLDEPENAYLRAHSDKLLEVYTPVRQKDSDGRVLAVIEFYQWPDEVFTQIAAERLRSWGIVGAITLVVYLLLVGVVRRGSAIIARQQARLRSHMTELEGLHARLRHAAGRTTALNEQALRRIGADLHAGPGQALALALLRFEAVHCQCACGCLAAAELETLRGVVGEAMSELRAIAAGLRLPQLEPLGPADVVRRAVHTHERRTGLPVALELDELPEQAPLATKIVLFRTLEEALSNATRHGQGAAVRVRAWLEADALAVCVADRGPGFAPERSFDDGHLGLANIRERAELLGGHLEVKSAPGTGTRVRVWLPVKDRGPEA